MLIQTLRLNISALAIFFLSVQKDFITYLILTVSNHPSPFLYILHSWNHFISFIGIAYLPLRTQKTPF